jgi:hypothetical protein
MARSRSAGVGILTGSTTLILKGSAQVRFCSAILPPLLESRLRPVLNKGRSSEPRRSVLFLPSDMSISRSRSEFESSFAVLSRRFFDLILFFAILLNVR